ncbi:hypothetical protein ACF0H5_005323 [Mactra antiquata]
MYILSKKTVSFLLNILLLAVVILSWIYTILAGRWAGVMEVKNDKSAMLSNYEVLNLLSDMHKGQNKQSKMQTNLATISYEITQYLENMACSKQSPEVIGSFMKALEPFNFTKAETLQLLNLRPKSAVEIQLIIEESEERLTEEQIYEVLDIIREHLPGNDEEEEMENDDQGE